MSIITSYSVGKGDMFTINHDTDDYTIIDCCYDYKEDFDYLIKKIKLESLGCTLRFISTHPDEDHIKGMGTLSQKLGIRRFYIVENNAVKNDYSENFEDYRCIRDGEKESIYVLPISQDRSAGNDIIFLWPDTSNKDFLEALKKAANGNSFNNISPIIMYSTENDIKILWMGDLETEFMEKIKYEVDWSKVDILFAPHHGRASGRVPSDILEAIDPTLIVIGEAPSKDIDYYSGYDTITQNRAGTINLVCSEDVVKIYCENMAYNPLFKKINNLRNINYTKYGYLKGSFRV